jgi:hypothetical protein
MMNLLNFIVLDRVSIDYLHYLKNKYLNSKFMVIYRDLRRITEGDLS